MSSKTTLTKPQIRALDALKKYRDIKQAAKKACVSDDSIYEWIIDIPEFQVVAGDLYREAVLEVVLRVIRNCNLQLQNLLQGVNQEGFPASARLLAAAALVGGRKWLVGLDTLDEVYAQLRAVVESEEDEVLPDATRGAA